MEPPGSANISFSYAGPICGTPRDDLQGGKLAVGRTHTDDERKDPTMRLLRRQNQEEVWAPRNMPTDAVVEQNTASVEVAVHSWRWRHNSNYALEVK